MQIALSQAQAEAADKDAKIAKLEASFKEKQELVEYRGYQYRKGADGKTARATVFAVVSGKGILMMTVQTVKPGRPEQCPECKSDYQNAPSFQF